MRGDPVTEWKCDRCGATTLIPLTATPTGWSGVAVLMPPLREDDAKRSHLCDSCTRDLRRFLEPLPKESPESGYRMTKVP